MKNNKQKHPYRLATVFFVVVFFLVGLFTMGGFSHTGEAYYVAKETRAVYQFELESEQLLKDVYLNVGAVYAARDNEDATLTVQTSTSTVSTSEATWTTVESFALTQSGLKGESGLFNWVKVIGDLKKNANIKRVSIKSNVSFDLNEIAFVDYDGNLIKAKVADHGNEGLNEDELAKAFDAQDSFSAKTSVYRNFTQEEGAYLSYLRNLSLGSTYYEEDAYIFAEDFGAVAVLALAPSILAFGETTFALRLPSLLATTATMVGLALFFTLLFKNEKYGFLSACCFALCGLAWTVGRIGAPYAFVACALVYAVYFAYLFFAKGISEHNIARGAANLLLSGLFSSIAVAMEVLAILPVVGIVVLLVFGFIRQKKAHEYTLEKLERIEDEERRAKLVRKEKFIYKNKLRTALGYSVCGFVVAYFCLIFISSIICHNAYVRAYGNLGFILLLWKNVSAGFSTVVTTAAANASQAIAFAWFLPLKATVAYLNANAQWLVLANPVLTVLALICLIATTVSVIKNFKATDKKNNRIRRVYFVLLGATLLIVLSAVIKGVNQTTGALAFYAFYYGFILLASYSLSSEDVEKTVSVQTEESTETDATEKTKTACKCCKCCKLCKTLLTVALALSAVAFLVAIPALFGFETIALWTKMIGWLTIL